jgi:hypothetical protein
MFSFAVISNDQDRNDMLQSTNVPNDQMPHIYKDAELLGANISQDLDCLNVSVQTDN